MANLFGRRWTRKQLLERVGDPSQLATVRPCTLTEGASKGVSAVEFATGSGLRFTVVPDRGMDISAADHNGRSLCWRSPTGEVAPQFYQPEGIEWLRGFFGGLLTTCGLTYFGAPCEDQGQSLGLHGRVSNLPAREVHVQTGWDGDEYLIGLTGRVVEASVFGPCLSLSRSIFTFLGQDRLFLHDEVTNIGHEPAPHMILYHVNVGFPALDANSKLLIPSRKAIPRDPTAAKGGKDFGKSSAPAAKFAEQVFYHELAEERGSTMAGVVNPDIGFGMYVGFNTKQFPCFVQWRMLGKGTYVVGLEPGTNRAGGRAEERAAGRLITLAPGQSAVYDLEFGALTSAEECAEFERGIKELIGSNKKRR
jgi:hypothetical protein